MKASNLKEPRASGNEGVHSDGKLAEDTPALKRGGDGKPAAKDVEFEEASAVVAKHVKLLKEYNEIKDVGQQLIGMVAENPVGSLYENGEFGVGPKD
ncbi:hypothetical protein C8034_v012002 [Colletotrichum sidae]|uniref:DNA repair protein SWI5-like protein n=1 Tax=Colletotrichum sidae TaxID=1347389 RepID=A0A4R8TK98_9PEZI|nr:hypothetical protein C8034_v012002 [Colletotrichum sidae]